MILGEEGSGQHETRGEGCSETRAGDRQAGEAAQYGATGRGQGSVQGVSQIKISCTCVTSIGSVVILLSTLLLI